MTQMFKSADASLMITITNMLDDLVNKVHKIGRKISNRKRTDLMIHATT